jgi:hypothetical protein
MKTRTPLAGTAAMFAASILTATAASAASTSGPSATITATATISAGTLSLDVSPTQLTVNDARGNALGWKVTLSGDVSILTEQCASDSTCTLPDPGPVNNYYIDSGAVVTADTGTGLGTVVFGLNTTGPIVVDLVSAP